MRCTITCFNEQARWLCTSEDEVEKRGFSKTLLQKEYGSAAQTVTMRTKFKRAALNVRSSHAKVQLIHIR